MAGGAALGIRAAIVVVELIQTASPMAAIHKRSTSPASRFGLPRHLKLPYNSGAV